MMKNWLKIAAVMLCLLLGIAGAEEAAENAVIYFHDGGMVLLPAEIANDDARLAEYCNTYFPGRLYTRDAEAAAYTYDVTVSEAWAVRQYGEGSRAMAVELVKLGVNTSVVTTMAGGELTVPTAELTVRGFDDKAHHVAVVSAPRTGTASLREKAAGSGKVVASCAAGTIVAVVEYGGSYTKILYEDAEGYIRTDCLVFQDTAKAPLGTGILHIKEAMDGKDSVTIRNTAAKSSSGVAEVPTGTTVTVHAAEGNWYIVEGDGWLGYVQEQNLKLNEN